MKSTIGNKCLIRLVLVTIVGAVMVGLACSPPSPVPGQTTPVTKAPGSNPDPGDTTLSKVETLSPDQAAWQKTLDTARKEPKLVMYSYYMPADIGLAMKRGFKQSTGLDIEFIIGGSPAAFVERVKVERRMGSPVASILDGSAVDLGQAKDEGLTQPLIPLPELKNPQIWRFDPTMDKEGHILVSNFAFYTSWVNTKLVKPEDEPKSYKDFLKPKWKGQVSVAAPLATAATVRAYYQLVKKNGILDDDYFRQLGKVALLAANLRMDAEKVARGEASVAFTSGVSPMGPFLQAGAPVKPVDMQEGVIGFRTGAVMLVQGAPSPNAGRAFVNWWFSKEGQATFHKAAGTESLRTDVPSFVPVAAQLTPKKVLMATSEDDRETTKFQRDRVVDKLLESK